MRPRQAPRLTDIVAHLVLVEAGVEQPVGEERQAVLDRGYSGLPRSVESRLRSRPTARMPSNDVLPGDLARVRRREAALEQAPRSASATWSSIEKFWQGTPGA